MSEPTYTFTITETERTALARVLGLLVSKLVAAPVQIDSCTCAATNGKSCPIPLHKPAVSESPTGGTQAARAVLSPPASPSPTRGGETAAPPAAAPANPQIALRDRWARDRKGNELANPTGCESFEAKIWKAEKIPAKPNKKAYFKLTWESPAGHGFGDATFFDEKLFAFCAAQTGKKTAVHVVRSGNYLNLVGIRA